jgi:hypothetical protein
MEKNLLKTLGGVILLAVILGFVAAGTISTFSDGSSIKNLTFTGNENLNLFIKIAQNSSVNYSTVKLKDVSNTWLYQENADLYSSEYYDASGANSWGKIYMNYSKNSSFFLGSKWRVAQGYEDSPYIDEIEIPELCFNQDPIQFREYIFQGEQIATQFNYSVEGDCYNGSDWINITPIRYEVWFNSVALGGWVNLAYDGNWATGTTYNGQGDGDIDWVKKVGPAIYGINEEAIIWFLNKTNVSKVSIDSLNDSIIDYSNDSLWNGLSAEQTDVDLNASAINENIDSCACDGCFPSSGYCNMPLIFHSDTEGKLQVSNIDVATLYDDNDADGYTLDVDCNDADAAINPGTAEICDEIDNDCDTAVDEVFANKGDVCSVSIGECARSGNYVCNGAHTGTQCDAIPGMPAAETCDGLDNDCDGAVDESLTKAADIIFGECSTNTQTCSAGVWSNDVTNYIPIAEIPGDGLDNDCDACTSNLLNETTSWTNVSCLVNDKMNQTRNITQYDTNNCGEISNQTFVEFQATETCDFCTPNLLNTTWSQWINTTCVLTQMNQSSFFTQYDNNTCYAITGLASDNFTNITYYNYTLVGPQLENTTFGAWYDTSSCYANNTKDQVQNATQYDLYNCAANTTVYNYQEANCTYVCSPDWTNISYSNWTNLTECTANNSVIQERNITQQDSSNCGLGTFSASSTSKKNSFSTQSSSFNNRIITETKTDVCDYCAPSWVCNNYDINGNCLDCLDSNYCYNQTQHLSDNYTNGTLANLTVNTSTSLIQNVSDALNGTVPGNNTVTNSTFNSSTLDTIEIFIDNHPISEWTTVTGILEIELTRANKKIAEFDYNFTNGTIDFNQLLIEQNNNNSADKAYVILRGIDTTKLINQTKTLYMNGIQRNINWICIKDADINSTNDISQNCQGADETHVQCNGQDFNGYSCTENTTSNQYKITGLHHSGVIESDAPSTSSSGGRVSSLDVSNETQNNTLVNITEVISEKNKTVPANNSAYGNLNENDKGTNNEGFSITGAAIGTLKDNSKNIALGFIILIILALIITNLRRN